MIAKLKAASAKFWDWCKRSETILWARVQVLVGAIWTVLAATDLSPVLPSKWLTAWLVISGVVTEVLRRIKGETTL